MERRAVLGVAAGAVAAGATVAQGSAHAVERERGGGAGRRPVARFDVISDIQGDLADLRVALRDMARTNPRGSGMAVAGDITPRGYDAEYAQVRAELARQHVRPGDLAWAIGNHEFYVPKWRDPDTLAEQTWPNGTTEDSLFRSFYRFAGRGSVYAEKLFDGIPVLSLGTEKYLHYHDPKLWDEVWLSEAQFAWLEDRLRYWSRRRRPVMVVSHHPLPDTVSGSRNALYQHDYVQAERLLALLGRHRDVFFFCGHTHWDLTLSDWYVRRVVPGTANPEGFSVVNTGAVQTGYRDDGKGGEVAVEGAFNQGLQVEVYRDRVRLRARDFARARWLKEITVPLSTAR